MTPTAPDEIAAREDRLLDQELDRELETLLAAKGIAPAARLKMRALVKHYKKFGNPFAVCVRDKRKEMGPIRARLACATLKGVMKETSAFQKNRFKKAGLSDDQISVMAAAPPIDDEVMRALNTIADGQLEQALSAAENAASMKLAPA